MKYKRFAFDPNYLKGAVKYRVKKNRGAGLYYLRGNGQWSKVDETKKRRMR